ncbi:MAG TPA: hypothetical protein ENI23_03125 [bacterium]|nr:hypothetical protein [bacterium]
MRKEIIRQIEKRLATLEAKEPFIGEYYKKHFFKWSPRYYWKWVKFTAKQKTDKIDDYIKIDGDWIKTKRIIFYDGLHNPLRKKIEKKFETE